MANTYLDMIARIEDETRYDSSADRAVHKLCIQDAIAHYEVERFWWNEARALTFNTVAAQRNYGVAAHANIPYILTFDIVTLARSATDIFALEKQDFVVDEALNADGSTTGIPYYYSYYSQELWLDPVPDAAYAVRVEGLFKLTQLAADADTNAWVTLGEGEEMIRNRAKAIFYTNYTRDEANAARALQQAEAAYMRLKGSTHKRGGTNTVRPYL
jgi:hypothetical protein